jgi:glycosyltransferase involved in cell wall biosynthesis
MALGAKVFVVDDGSTDRSGEIAASHKGITLLKHPTNLGKGAALRTGFTAAKSTANWAITIDADGQYDPLEAGDLIKKAKETRGTRPIVVARRTAMDGIHVPWTSRMGRGFSNFWVYAAGGGRHPDTQSGLRVYPLPEVLQLKSKSNRFQYEVEILALAGWHDIPILSVPVTVTYTKNRVSHFRPWVDFWRNSATFTRLITMRLLVPKTIRRKWTTIDEDQQ